MKIGIANDHHGIDLKVKIIETNKKINTKIEIIADNKLKNSSFFSFVLNIKTPFKFYFMCIL